jgi:hypothetical protein
LPAFLLLLFDHNPYCLEDIILGTPEFFRRGLCRSVFGVALVVKLLYITIFLIVKVMSM